MQDKLYHTIISHHSSETHQSLARGEAYRLDQRVDTLILQPVTQADRSIRPLRSSSVADHNPPVDQHARLRAARITPADWRCMGSSDASPVGRLVGSWYVDCAVQTGAEYRYSAREFSV